MLKYWNQINDQSADTPSNNVSSNWITPKQSSIEKLTDYAQTITTLTAIANIPDYERGCQVEKANIDIIHTPHQNTRLPKAKGTRKQLTPLNLQSLEKLNHPVHSSAKRTKVCKMDTANASTKQFHQTGSQKKLSSYTEHSHKHIGGTQTSVAIKNPYACPIEISHFGQVTKNQNLKTSQISHKHSFNSSHKGLEFNSTTLKWLYLTRLLCAKDSSHRGKHQPLLETLNHLKTLCYVTGIDFSEKKPILLKESCLLSFAQELKLCHQSINKIFLTYKELAVGNSKHFRYHTPEPSPGGWWYPNFPRNFVHKMLIPGRTGTNFLKYDTEFLTDALNTYYQPAALDKIKYPLKMEQ
ncbi:hypothetical protein PR048_014294 [Dryococelus australis]|uniref:Uncharacterized protein n=1 Tax=Dryococelus australis TaxID=614101 RepID=A0ABQ9HDU1_9NEOP|nr:hypothetical protein PR048_014294 [Dryococelus australis]